jgi:hypothetical protein
MIAMPAWTQWIAERAWQAAVAGSHKKVRGAFFWETMRTIVESSARSCIGTFQTVSNFLGNAVG